uniref:Uncharacterized protein n=1 Tax=Alexandrium monilatum TaxID=311494 RepID=A0A7S4URW6_9DINO
MAQANAPPPPGALPRPGTMPRPYLAPSQALLPEAAAAEEREEEEEEEEEEQRLEAAEEAGEHPETSRLLVEKEVPEGWQPQARGSRWRQRFHARRVALSLQALTGPGGPLACAEDARTFHPGKACGYTVAASSVYRGPAVVAVAFTALVAVVLAIRTKFARHGQASVLRAGWNRSHLGPGNWKAAASDTSLFEGPISAELMPNTPSEMAKCYLYPACVAAGIRTKDHACCPNDRGEMLGCCDLLSAASQALATPPPRPGTECARFPSCYWSGLRLGACCPDALGTMLSCCPDVVAKRPAVRALCSSFPACIGEGRTTGVCCPDENGTVLACCSDPVVRPPRRTTPEPLSSRLKGACSRFPTCQGLGLDGACCPTARGYMMPCCSGPLKVPYLAPPPPSSACSSFPKCAADGVYLRNCCPHDNGTVLSCCAGTPPLGRYGPAAGARTTVGPGLSLSQLQVTAAPLEMAAAVTPAEPPPVGAVAPTGPPQVLSATTTAAPPARAAAGTMPPQTAATATAPSQLVAAAAPTAPPRLATAATTAALSVAAAASTVSAQMAPGAATVTQHALAAGTSAAPPLAALATAAPAPLAVAPTAPLQTVAPPPFTAAATVRSALVVPTRAASPQGAAAATAAPGQAGDAGTAPLPNAGLGGSPPEPVPQVTATSLPFSPGVSQPSLEIHLRGPSSGGAVPKLSRERVRKATQELMLRSRQKPGQWPG